MKKSLSFVLAGMLSLGALIAGGCGSKPTAGPAPAKETKVEKKEEKASSGEKYPTKHIELIVPFAAGGGTDLVGRALAESLKPILKQEVVVINKTGGSGTVGMQEGLAAKPDGYTLTLVTREVTSLPLQGLAPFKTLDFKFVGNVNKDPGVLVVSADSPYKTVEDLLEALKKNPGKMKFAASAIPNYYGIQLSQTANVKFITVPFQGAAPALIEILGGRSDFGLYNPGEIKAQVEAGRVRPLAVMDDKRFEGLKDVPTFKEKGLDIVSGTYRGIAVPQKTPDDVTKVLEDAIAQAVKDPKFTEFMNSSFLGIGYMNSGDFKKYVEKDIEVLKPIIEEAKVQK